MRGPVKTEPYPFANTIGPKIRKARTDRGLSDKKFSERTGISRRHLVEFQKGANASLMIAFRAMQTLGIRELSHDFEGETLTLTISDTPAPSVHPQLLLATAEGLEQAIAHLMRTALTLRELAAKASRPATKSKRTAGDRSLADAAAIIEDFGSLAATLDDESKLDLLRRLTLAATAPQATTTAGEQSPAASRKRKSRSE